LVQKDILKGLERRDENVSHGQHAYEGEWRTGEQGLKSGKGGRGKVHFTEGKVAFVVRTTVVGGGGWSNQDKVMEMERRLGRQEEKRREPKAFQLED